MRVAPAEQNLQSRVKLGQGRLFTDKEPPSDRRRYAAQSGTELHCTHCVLGVHWSTLTPMAARLKPRSRTRIGPLSPSHDTNYANWCGTIVSDAKLNARAIFGAWTIPNVQRVPTDEFDLYWSSIWVGLDGGNASSGSQDCLQAGSEQDIGDPNDVEDPNWPYPYYCWYQWHPNQPYGVQNFPVQPGQSILTAVLSSVGDSYGTVSFVNLSTGTYTSVLLATAPAGVTLAGDTAEWILEGYPGTLPEFGIVNMTYAYGCMEPAGTFTPTDLSQTSGLAVAENIAIKIWSTYVAEQYTVSALHFSDQRTASSDTESNPVT